MPKFFICESGPMGGISIVFVADSETDALAWVALNDSRELHIYKAI